MQRKSSVNRRQFLRLAGSLAAGIASSHVVAAPAVHTGRGAMQERQLSFYNLHTGEQVKTAFWADGSYLAEGLQVINRVLRDHRNDQVRSMDVRLLELLHRLHRQLDTQQPLHIISGYRSPETNAMLRQRSSGVAKRSLHMEGMAVDIRVPEVALAQVRKTALALQGGGVGYYRASDFVHVDVGRVRSWG